ncbi:hypothetical protein Ciccas_009562 [Cichlidogyrus casuarinus]|uniref:Uncharacterized protein n=1 Tax=Cichlidogyrus casuarinus TaxID=1844966 RepID=A0ABD2PWP8_9PLAT
MRGIVHFARKYVERRPDLTAINLAMVLLLIPVFMSEYPNRADSIAPRVFNVSLWIGVPILISCVISCLLAREHNSPPHIAYWFVLLFLDIFILLAVIWCEFLTILGIFWIIGFDDRVVFIYRRSRYYPLALFLIFPGIVTILHLYCLVTESDNRVTPQQSTDCDTPTPLSTVSSTVDINPPKYPDINDLPQFALPSYEQVLKMNR